MRSKWCRDKAVVVVVYAEKPRGQGGGRRHQFHQKVSSNNGSRGRGYSRRAELLDYARHLREPTQSTSSHINQRPTTQVSDGDGNRKQKHLTPPLCFCRWSLVVTRFLGSAKDKEKKNHKKKVPKSTKMKALVKSLQVQKKGSHVSKLLAALRKRP